MYPTHPAGQWIDKIARVHFSFTFRLAYLIQRNQYPLVPLSHEPGPVWFTCLLYRLNPARQKSSWGGEWMGVFVGWGFGWGRGLEIGKRGRSRGGGFALPALRMLHPTQTYSSQPQVLVHAPCISHPPHPTLPRKTSPFTPSVRSASAATALWITQG